MAEVEQADDTSKKKVQLTFTPTKIFVPLPLDSIKLPERSTPSPPPTTDHFLQIVPKPTLLGKQQAKKRLKAFAKTNALINSPTSKKIIKPVKLLEVSEEKFDEHGVKSEELTLVKKPPKRGVNHDEKSKEIIEQIETIKKDECKLMEEAKDRLRTRSRSRERRSRYNKTKDRLRFIEKKHDIKYSIRDKYPDDWREFKDRNLSIDKLKYMPNKKKTVTSYTEDAIKMLRFKAPPQVFPNLKYKRISGQDDFVPSQFIRFTTKHPRISYSVNFYRVKQTYFNRKQVFSEISRGQKQSIEDLAAQACQQKPMVPVSSPIKTRKWYTKAVLPCRENEIEILEPSVGLSILQNYTDEDEPLDKEEEEEDEKIEPEKEIQSEGEEKKKSKKKEKKKKKKKHREVKEKNSKEKKETDQVKANLKTDNDVHDSKFVCDTVINDLSNSLNNANSKPFIDFNDFEDNYHTLNPPKEDDVKHEKKEQKGDTETPKQEKTMEVVKEKESKLDIFEIKSDDENTNQRIDKNKDRKKVKDHKEVHQAVEKESRFDRDRSLNRSRERRRISHSPTKEKDTSKKPNKIDDSKRRSVESKKGASREKCKSSRTPDNKLDKKKSKSREVSVEKIRKSSHEPQKSSKRSISRSRSIEKVHLKVEIKTENTQSDRENRTPDTDEYHSHWESEDEVSPSKKKPENNSWESEEEDDRVTHHSSHYLQRPQKTYDLLERSLEMPLNISFGKPREAVSVMKMQLFSNEDSWERGEFLKLKNDYESVELEKERRTLSEERRKLELERLKIEEMRTRILGLEEMRNERILLKEIKQEVPDEYTEKRRSRKSRWEDTVVTTIKQEKIEESIPLAIDIKPLKIVMPESNMPNDKLNPFLESKKVNSILENALETVPSEKVALTPENVPFDKVSETLTNKSPALRLPPAGLTSKLSGAGNTVKISEVREKVNALEDEYEQFMKAVSSNIPLPNEMQISPKRKDNQRKRKYSSSSSDSSSSSESSSSETSSSSESSRKTDSKESEGHQNVTPMPVPSPVVNLDDLKIKTIAPFNQTDVVPKSPTLCKVDSTSSPNKSMDFDIESSKHLTVVNKTRNTDEKVNEPEVPSNEIADYPKRNRKVNSRDVSPKRRRSSPRRSPLYRGRYSPKRKRRDYSPRRRDYSPKRRYSPSRHRYSPKRGSRDYSPRRNRSTSPPHKRRSISPMKVARDGESIQQTLSRIAGMERFDNSNKSPVNSPMDSFRRSIADSTISDDQLLQNQESYSESPAYYNNMLYKNETSSPKRIPLDDRINQVLGIDKEEPKPISTTYSQNYTNYNQSYYDQYNDYENKTYNDYSQTSEPPPSTIKVLQVGNVLQVVPTEEIPQVPVKKSPVIENAQKIVQVGNMLQIVPTPIMPVEVKLQPVASPSPVAAKEKQSAEDLMKLKSAERKAERDRRRLERDRRRKEKEKKQKEKEKLKQLKLKQKTEEMIKRALLFDIDGADDDDVEEDIDEEAKVLPSILSLINRPPGKSILISRNEDDAVQRAKKGVKFADGVIPGEGTSPSGGEELSSPPPEAVKLPKEKRFTKTKKPKRIKVPKKKVKVKVVRKTDVDDEDSLPPPSPPPGSPPPHLFPPRIKSINAISHNYVPSLPQINFPFNQSPIRPDFAQPPPQISQLSQPVIGQTVPQMQTPPPQLALPHQLAQPPPNLGIPPNIIHHHQYSGPPLHQSTPPPSLHSGSSQLPVSALHHPGTPIHHAIGLPLQGQRHLQNKLSYNISISSPQNGSSHHHHQGPHHG